MEAIVQDFPPVLISHFRTTSTVIGKFTKKGLESTKEGLVCLNGYHISGIEFERGRQYERPMTHPKTSSQSNIVM